MSPKKPRIVEEDPPGLPSGLEKIIGMHQEPETKDKHFLCKFKDGSIGMLTNEKMIRHFPKQLIKHYETALAVNDDHLKTGTKRLPSAEQKKE